jgi:WD40 repeat protein
VIGATSVTLDGLDAPSALALLRAHDLRGSDATLTTLATHFSSNPLALNWVSESIRSLFGGDATVATNAGFTVFNGLQELFNEQLGRLSLMERHVLVWLAITREPLSVDELVQRPAVAPGKRELFATLKSLAHRFLLQTTTDGLSVPVIVGEYLTQQFITSAVEEIVRGEYATLHSFPLIQPTGTHEALQIQQRVLLAPVAREISAAIGGNDVAVTHIRSAIDALPRDVTPAPSFLVGNLLNVLRALGGDTTALDLSRLCVWQSDLRDVVLRDANMEKADLRRSVFTRTVGNALCVRFHPKETLVVAGTTHGEIHIFEMPTLNHVATLRGHSDWVRAIAFNADGSLMASGGEDQRVRIWSTHNWEMLHELRGHTNRIRAVAFSADGTLLGSGSTDGTIRLWSTRTGRCVRRLREHTDWVRAIDFAGELLASGGSDRTVRLWRVRTGETLRVLRGHTATVRCLAFHPDGIRLATGGSDKTVRLWNTVTGRCIGVWRSHTDRVRSLAFTGDGRLLFSGGGDGHIVMWDTERGVQVGTLDGHKNQIWSVATTRDGSYLTSTSEDQTMRLWQPISRRCARVVHGYINQLWSVAFTRDGRHLLAGGGDKQVRVWDLANNRVVQNLVGHTSWIRSLAVTNDDRFCASTGDDRTVRLWNLETRQVTVVGSHTQRLRAVALSPDGLTMAYAGKTTDIAFYNLATGRQSRIRGLNDPTFALAFSGDNRLLAGGGSDGIVRVWDYRRHRLVLTLGPQRGWIRGITFVPIGAALAVAGEDRTVSVWNQLATSTQPKVLAGHGDRIWSIAASPQRPLLATASDDQTIRIWNCINGKCERVLEGHESPVRSVAFDPDGVHVASGSYDGVVKLWNVETGNCLKTLRAARPYEGMRVRSVIGLTTAQFETLKAFGATD